jgi:exo-beta-1,3-glucanase (GH17 family)
MNYLNNSPASYSSKLVFYWEVISFTLILLSLFSKSAIATEQSTKSYSFFEYLSVCKPEPALIAFNPSNFDPKRPIDVSDTALSGLRDDLRALAPNFNGLVLYETLPKLTKAILSTALEQGYRAVLLGVWNPKQDEEIKQVAELITQFHNQMALAVVIGNEGLIGNRYTIKDMQSAAKKLRALLPKGVIVPFTTSEPVSEYGLAAVREFGEFLAPNIHPAVDKNSVDPAAAAAWVKKRAHALGTVGKKPVLVKETGVPNGGTSGYTPEIQRAFWQEYLQGGRFIQSGGEPWISYAAAFEAFDMPWKAQKSGLPIEGHWGLLDDKRQHYPAFDAWQHLGEPRCLEKKQGK